jgi:hypothetical protein
MNEYIKTPDNLPVDPQVLFDHQCWAWGKDVTRQKGNLLLEFGFEQVRSKANGMTQYTKQLTDRPDLYLSLWGFGFYVGDHQDGIFVGRSKFTPMYAPGELKLHAKSDQYMFRQPSGNVPMLLNGLGEISRYEEWIASNHPVSYRKACFEDFPRNIEPAIGTLLAGLWWDLKKNIRQENNGIL